MFNASYSFSTDVTGNNYVKREHYVGSYANGVELIPYRVTPTLITTLNNSGVDDVMMSADFEYNATVSKQESRFFSGWNEGGMRFYNANTGKCSSIYPYWHPERVDNYREHSNSWSAVITGAIFPPQTFSTNENSTYTSGNYYDRIEDALGGATYDYFSCPYYDGINITANMFAGFIRKAPFAWTELESFGGYDVNSNLMVSIVVETLFTGNYNDTDTFYPHVKTTTYSDIAVTNYSTVALEVVADADTHNPWLLTDNVALKTKIDDMLQNAIFANPPTHLQNVMPAINIKKAIRP